MRSAVESLEGNKVKLSVEVDEADFEKEVDKAFRRIAREVLIPGFRPGKAPRQIIEARLGKETGRAEALRESLPGYYSQALLENDVDAIADPTIEITSGQEEGRIAFDAVVEVRPQLHIAGYQGLRVTVPDPKVSAAEVDERIDRLRANFGELVDVERGARKGDFLTIDVKGVREGAPVGALTTDDFVYELGSGDIVPEFDQQLPGAKVGGIYDFTADIPGGSVGIKVLVKNVQERALPAVTDEWVKEASEFDTVAELRADIEKNMASGKRVNTILALRTGTVESLVQLVGDEPPQPLVDAEVQRRAQEFSRHLQSQGVSLARYLASTGVTDEQLAARWTEEAALSVKADLALRAVAEAEGIAETEEEVDAEVARLAQRFKVNPSQMRAHVERAGQWPAVRSDVKKGKALDWLVEHVEAVDEQGHPVELPSSLKSDESSAGQPDLPDLGEE
ncbi:MAG: trigger factor [Acidimicrobiales bacterium]